MSKKIIFITGSTDGIGLEAAKQLFAQGHHVLLHGRSKTKLAKATKMVQASSSSGGGSSSTDGQVEGLVADLSVLSQVDGLAEKVLSKHSRLDVLINNAGVFKTSAGELQSRDGFDVRFSVNTLAPYHLTRRLLPIIPTEGGKVVSVSSAAQAPVDVNALQNGLVLEDYQAYSQSKLAVTLWTIHMARQHPHGPVFLSVNPGSMLGTKMVKEGFGSSGRDIGIGADILCRCALDSDAFGLGSTGKYFDNDSGRFALHGRDASNPKKVEAVVRAIENAIDTTLAGSR